MLAVTAQLLRTRVLWCVECSLRAEYFLIVGHFAVGEIQPYLYRSEYQR